MSRTVPGESAETFEFFSENDDIYFNAARLDRSMALKTSDYIALSKPRIEQIAVPAEAQQN